MSRRSTILRFCDHFYRSDELDLSAFVFYAAILKVFDSVPHHKLIAKLAAFGFDYSFIRLIKSYLCAGSQRDRVILVLSNVAFISSGTPQGSILACCCFWSSEMISLQELR